MGPPQFRMPQSTHHSFPSIASHTSSVQEWMEPAPNRGLEGARKHLEDNSFLRKRKHADDGEVPSKHAKRAYSLSRNRFRDVAHMNNATKCGPIPEFKRPQPLQRERLQALQSQLIDQERSDGGTPSKGSRVDSLPTSPKTPRAPKTNPVGPCSTALASPKLSSTLSPNASSSSHQSPPTRRAEHTPMLNQRTPKYSSREPSAYATGASDRLVRPSNGKSQVSEPQRPTLKLPSSSSTPGSVRQDRTSNTAREQMKSNGSTFTNINNFHVPTIDRRIRHPPPEPAELNRVLAQVPDILRDLDEKQAQVIRNLANRVNKQDEEIRELKANKVELKDNLNRSNDLNAELTNKLEQVDKRLDDEVQALREESALFQKQVEKHINRQGERLFAEVKSKLKRLEDQTTMEDDYEPSEELIDVQHPEKAEEEDTNIFLQQE